MRFRVEPLDVPPSVAARRLGLTPAEFEYRLPRLLSRGFPPADPDTGTYDLEAIDRWRHRRHPHLFPDQAATLTAPPVARDASQVVRQRIAGLRNGG